MRSRPRLVAWVLLPCAVACAGGARLLPAAALWEVLAGLLLVRGLAVLFLDRGDRSFLPRRALPVLRLATIFVLSYAFFPTSDGAAEPVIVLVTAVNAFTCLWLLGPQGALVRFSLLLASAVQTIAVAHARPDTEGLAQVLLYAASLLPALLAFERTAWTHSRGGSERGLRRVEGFARGLGTAAFAGTVLRLAAVGVPLGTLAFAGAVLWAQPSRTKAPAANPSEGGSLPVPGYDEEGGVTGLDPGRRLYFMPRLKRDRSLLLGVRLRGGLPSDEPLYLRSGVYDLFGGAHWVTTVTPPVRRHDHDDGVTDDWIPLADGAAQARGAATDLRIRELRGGRFLHLPPEPHAVRFDAGRGPYTVVRSGRAFQSSPPLDGGDAYEVRWRPTSPDPDRLLAARSDASVAPHRGLVATPPEAERLLALARSVIGDEARPAVRAARLAEHLRSSYDYALEVERVDRRRPVHDFLFRTRRGNCQQFAGSMVLLLRALGHPARLAVGFRVADESWSSLRGEYEVRASDAHAWAEMWFDGVGWVRYDATAPDSAAVDAPKVAQDAEEEAEAERDLADRLLRPDDEDRQEALGRLAAALGSLPWGWIAATGLVVALALAVRGRRAEAGGLPPAGATAGPASDAYRRVLRAYEREGVRRRGAETPSEFLRAATRAVPDAAEPFSRLTRRFEGERYGALPRDRQAGDAEASAVVAAVRGARARAKAAAGAARR